MTDKESVDIGLVAAEAFFTLTGQVPWTESGDRTKSFQKFLDRTSISDLPRLIVESSLKIINARWN